MNLLYNLESKRSLIEGEVVQLLSGPHKGTLGTVLGFDLVGEKPVVLMTPSRNIVLSVANELQSKRLLGESKFLGDFPLLNEIYEAAAHPITIGSLLCFRVPDGSMVACVPKKQGTKLLEIFESCRPHSISNAVSFVLQNAFVSRLPHLFP